MKATRWLALLLPVAVILVRAQGNPDKTEIKTTPVAGNVYMLEGAGGNIGVSAGPDGLLIVDDQFAPLTNKISAALARINPGPLRFVLNTHWHGDHTGGNAFFGKQASIIAHDNARKRLAEKKDSVKEEVPVVTFEKSLSVHFNGEEIKVFYLGPGHTDGDSVIYFTKSRVIHMGDQFFNGRFPFIDLGSGGDVAGYVKNVGEVLKLVPGDVKVIPGHGGLASRADLEKFHGMLLETTDLVRKAIAEGKTAEQVKAAGLPDKWKDWGTGFINTSRWLDMVYNNLKK
ncbi:MAG TPA: MBL fold metallo-hydrolase [Verrucomicrobiae bacterium]|nr:MBL fold metallo-hydrolase [Verrucomicrobiae bacterium]